MYKLKVIKFLSTLLIIFIISISFSNAKIIKNIIINGNDRISNEAIIMFSEIKLGENISSVKLNDILKRDLWWDCNECLKYGLVDRIE